MRRWEKVRGVALVTATGCLLLASCSGEPEKRPYFPKTLCGTNISTNSLQEMYPGPYSEVTMIPAKEGNIDALKKKEGRAKGACDVWITQKDGDVFTTVGVVVELHPEKSVGELFERYEKWYPDHQQQPLTLGTAKGFAMYNASFLAFECRKPDKIPSEIKDRGVSVRMLLPDHPDGLNVDRGKLATEVELVVSRPVRG